MRKIWYMWLVLFLSSLTALVACSSGDDDDDSASDDDAGDDDAGDDDAGDDDAGDDDAGDDDAGDDDAGDDDAGDDDWSDLFPPPTGPLGTYRLYINEEETDFNDIPAAVTNEDSTTFPGETYSVIELGDLDTATNGQRTWFDLSTELQAGIRRSEIFEVTKDDPSFSITFDPAIVIEFGQPVGETRTHSTTGTWDFGGTTVDADFEAAATVVDDNATIEVPFGEVTGCLHVALTVTEIDGEGNEFPIDSNFYIHPAYGFVRVEMIPGFFSAELVDVP